MHLVKDEEEFKRLKQKLDEDGDDVLKDGKVSLVRAVKSLRRKGSFMNKVFGKKGTREVFEAFQNLDESCCGIISKEKLVDHLEGSFKMKATKTAPTSTEYTIIQKCPAEINAGEADIPKAPPLLAEHIISTIFDVLDRGKKNYVNMDDLNRGLKQELVLSLLRKILPKSSVNLLATRGAHIFSSLDSSGSGKVSRNSFTQNFFLGFNHNLKRNRIMQNETAMAEIKENRKNLEISCMLKDFCRKFNRHVTEFGEISPIFNISCPPQNKLEIERGIPPAPSMPVDFLLPAIFDLLDKKGKGYLTLLNIAFDLRKKDSILKEAFGVKFCARVSPTDVFERIDVHGVGTVTKKVFVEEAVAVFVSLLVEQRRIDNPPLFTRESLLPPASWEDRFNE